MVANVEKERRKKRNAGERRRMLALLGKDVTKSKDKLAALGLDNNDDMEMDDDD